MPHVQFWRMDFGLYLLTLDGMAVCIGSIDLCLIELQVLGELPMLWGAEA